MTNVDHDDSMRDSDDVAGRIRLHVQGEAGPILVVEGPDDEDLLTPYLPHVSIFPADGKRRALEAAEELRGFEAAVIQVVVDADFDPEIDEALSQVVLPYAARDLEMMLISLGGLHEVMRSQGSRLKLAALGGIDAAVERVLSAAESIARLRQFNADNGIGINFEKLKLDTRHDLKTLELKVEPLLITISQRHSEVLQRADLEDAIRTPLRGDRGARGKDAMMIAGVALRRLAGDRSAGSMVEDVLCAQLRTSVSLALESSAWLLDLRRRLSGSVVIGEPAA